MNSTNSQYEATTIHIRVDRDVKNDADKLFRNMGLSISSAVNMFFRQALAEQAIPFQPKVGQKILPRPYKTLEERLNNFSGVYEYEEMDTGVAVGNEVIDYIYS